MSETMFKAKCKRMKWDCSASKYGFRLSGSVCLVPGMRCPTEDVRISRSFLTMAKVQHSAYRLKLREFMLVLIYVTHFLNSIQRIVRPTDHRKRFDAVVTFCRRSLARLYVGLSDIVYDFFLPFLSISKRNTDVVPRLLQDRPLPNTLRFIIYEFNTK